VFESTRNLLQLDGGEKRERSLLLFQQEEEGRGKRKRTALCLTFSHSVPKKEGERGWSSYILIGRGVYEETSCDLKKKKEKGSPSIRIERKRCGGDRQRVLMLSQNSRGEGKKGSLLPA